MRNPRRLGADPLYPMQLDSHQHFWRYHPRDYDWIDDRMAAIRQDFTPTDLAPRLSANALDGSIAVQARQSLAETAWLLELAAAHPHVIRGVVGWLPLREQGAAIGDVLAPWAGRAALKGVRHVLQGEPDAYMADAAFNAALHQLPDLGLSYDLLVMAPQLPAAIALVDRHPELPMVLDHIAKPVVRGAPDPSWVNAIRELARREHVCCKVSGIVTEVPDWQWTTDEIRPYFETVLEAFGPQRLMFGSDWPVCLVAADYADWANCVRQLISPLSPDEQAAIMGGTAARFYRIPSP
ncbi:amidohydrolase family protein [Actomonas aquatica]|uniref:Amidohydrolase family protein n=1 Tax=Actomonas aquatica TaxID=2866162 RepID=A0ABZ1C8T4_9BACT|nr:amidohydrolase family protein [Opitutus sp. WL0086]WRQ86979.1 amidohydrolase family protein [Opitutus sp. WL0086]